jgi:hypothetical protein
MVLFTNGDAGIDRIYWPLGVLVGLSISVAASSPGIFVAAACFA